MINQKKQTTSFEEHLELKQLSPNTIHQYLYFKELFDKEFTEINQDTANKFILKHNHAVGKYSIKCYAEYLGISITVFKTKKQPKMLRDVPTKQKIYEVANNQNVRDRLIIRLMFECGLRVSEVLSIRKKDLNLEKNEVYGRGKGYKEFLLYFSDHTKTLLNHYLKELKDDSYLFSITRQRVWQIIKEIGLSHPHLLRHAYGTHLKKCGLDLIDLKEALRHSRLDTVAIYAHSDKTKLKQEIKKAFI